MAKTLKEEAALKGQPLFGVPYLVFIIDTHFWYKQSFFVSYLFARADSHFQ